MNRKELASQVYLLIKRDLNIKSEKLWQAIAETDDRSLLDEYEKLCDKHYKKKENK